MTAQATGAQAACLLEHEGQARIVLLKFRDAEGFSPFCSDASGKLAPQWFALPEAGGR